MTVLADGRIECVCLDGRRVTFTPGKQYEVAEGENGFVRVEKPKGWGYVVKGNYEEIRDALAVKEAA